MKNKLIRGLVLTLTFSMLLSGCGNSKDTNTEQTNSAGEITEYREPVMIENTTFSVGQVVTPADVVVLDGTEEMFLFMDSSGETRESFEITSDMTGGTFSTQYYVKYLDGYEFMGEIVFNVTGDIPTNGESSVADINASSYSDLVKEAISKDFTAVKTFNGNGIDTVSLIYDADKLYADAGNQISLKAGGSLYTISYVDVDNKDELITGMIEVAKSLKCTEEDFTEEAGWVLGKQYKTYAEFSQAYDAMVAELPNLYTTEDVLLSSSTSESTELRDYSVYQYMYKVGDMFVPLGTANFIYPLSGGGNIVISGLVTDVAYTYLNEEGTEEVSNQEPEEVNTTSPSYNLESPAAIAYFDAIKSATSDMLVGINDLAAMTIYGDLSVYKESVKVEGEKSPSEVLQEEAITGTGIDVIENEEQIVIEQQITNRRQTYAERYPNLYKWPDQQEIYGISPKKLIYSVLSSYDDQGKVTYETSLVPMWSTTLNKFLNDVSFGINANNIPNGTTGYGQNPNAGKDKEDEEIEQEETSSVTVDTSTLNKKTIITNFGDYEVVEYQGLLLLNDSTGSDIHVRSETTGKSYHVRATTSTAIQSARTSSIYDIKGDPSSWTSVKGNATVTSTGMTITPYTMNYKSLDDGSTVTADYIYTIQTNGGYFIIYGDNAPADISNDMSNIANSIMEASNE